MPAAIYRDVKHILLQLKNIDPGPRRHGYAKALWNRLMKMRRGLKAQVACRTGY